MSTGTSELSNYDITVVGSIFMDLICYADRLPKPGETLGGTDFQPGFGGKGANQCTAAQRLGAKTAFVGKLGNDVYGNEYYKNFVREGTFVGGIAMEEKVPTGVASILVGNDTGENLIIIVEGATKLVTPEYVEKAGEELIEKSKIVVCQLEIPVPSTVTALKLAKKHGIKTIFNPAPALANLPPEMFSLTDVLILNETEAEIISGFPEVTNIEQAKEAIAILKQRGSSTVILTLGAEGALLYDNELNSFEYCKAPKVNAVVDTTGAGDCFVGTFAFCISRGDSLKTALAHAVQNASDSVQRKGTQKSFPFSLVSATV